MIQDAASLDNLRPIAEPAPISWWPLAPGWWVLLSALAVLVLIFLVRVWRSWHANAYRRAALRELVAATDLAQVDAILKRTAICAYPREQVASLSGTAWLKWLDDTGGQIASDQIIHALTRGVYGKRSNKNAEEIELKAVVHFASHWIEHHVQQPSDQCDDKGERDKGSGDMAATSSRSEAVSC